MMNNIAVLDTETTGLTDSDQVFEVAVYDLDAGIHNTWTIQPDPEVVAAMHPKALEVNRFHERTSADDWRWDVKWNSFGYDADEMKMLLEDLAPWLNDKHILGAVPNFDTERIAHMYKAFEVPVPRWHYHLLDIEVLAVGYLLNQRALLKPGTTDQAKALVARIDELLTLPYKSDDLAEYFGVEPPANDDRHTALGDVRWTVRWFRRLLPNE